MIFVRGGLVAVWASFLVYGFCLALAYSSSESTVYGYLLVVVYERILADDGIYDMDICLNKYNK